LLPEADIIRKLLEKAEFTPFRITNIDLQSRSTEERKSRPVATLDLEWRGRSRRFAAQCKELSTPKFLEEAAEQARRFAKARGDSLPLVIVPYLNPEALNRLEAMEVSGLDLCGNGIVVVPGEWLVVRTGSGNQFPTSAPIKNVFRGTSSLVSRAFLYRPNFNSVTEVQDEVLLRGGQVHISTVSKVLHTLEEELIITRAERSIRLVDSARLLDLLEENYREPEVGRRVQVRVHDAVEFVGKLSAIAREQKVYVAADTLTRRTPGGLTAHKASFPVAVYVSSLQVLDEIIPTPAASHAEKIELIQTEELTVFFNPRWENGFPWTSLLQVYLTLARSDVRQDRERAVAVRAKIIGEQSQGSS
jgi:hypothetical protein